MPGQESHGFLGYLLKVERLKRSRFYWFSRMCWEPTIKTWAFVWKIMEATVRRCEFSTWLHHHDHFRKKIQEDVHVLCKHMYNIWLFQVVHTFFTWTKFVGRNFNPIIQSVRFPHHFLAGRKTQGFAWGADCLQDPRSTTTGSLRMLRLRRFKCLEHVAHGGVYCDAWSLFGVHQGLRGGEGGGWGAT